MSVKEEMVDGYLNNICSLIKNKRVHSEIKSEIKSHLEELEEGYEKEGMGGTAATELALKDIGNPRVIGENLNKVHKAKIDFKLVIAVCCLIIFGISGIFSFNKGQQDIILSNTYLIKDIVWIIIGAIFFTIGVLFDFRKIKKGSILLYSIGIVIEMLNFIIPYIGNARLKELINLTSLNLMQVVPYLILFSISGFYMKINWEKKNQVIVAGILGLVPLILMKLEVVSVLRFNPATLMRPETNFILLYLCYSIALIVLIYLNSKNKLITIITGFLEVIIFVGTNMLMAKNTVIGPEINNIINTSKFVGSGGTETGGSLLGMNYPLLNIIYNYGWLFGIIAIMVLLYFVYRIMRIPYLAKSSYGKSIGFSISIIISVEIIWSILMNLNIVPFSHLSVIFISYSGVGMILNLFLIGLLLNIYKGRTITQ